MPDLDKDLRQQARQIADSLDQARRPLVISGNSLAEPAILEAAGNVARALARRAKPGGLVLVRPEANSTGLALMGGQSLEWALEQLEQDRADALVVLENDLYQRAPRQQVDRALAQAQTLVVLDHQHTETLARATLALPAASFAEADGTLVSLEGRAQRFFQVYDPGYIRPETRIHESWRWLHALTANIRREPAGDITLDTVTRACAESDPALTGILGAAPGSDYRIDGLRLAREPHRYSGRTAMRANLSVAEPRVPQDPDTAFAFSMEGYSGSDRPRQLVPFAWAPGWNSPQAWNKFTDEVGGHLKGGDPGVRLLAPVPGQYDYSGEVPDPFHCDPDNWQLVLLPRLFGGEETSRRAEPIQERTEPARLTLSQADADRLKTCPGETLSVLVNDLFVVLPVHIDPCWPAGLAGVPVGVEPALRSGQRVTLAATAGTGESGQQPEVRP